MATKTVLEYVQACLSTMDSDLVDSISETAEASQVANLLSDCYYELLNRQEWAFLKSPVTLTALADVAKPTSFTLPAGVRRLTKVWYNVSTDGGNERRELKWVDPEVFLTTYGGGAEGTNKLLVTEGSQLQFYVRTDKMPTVYTTFDEKRIHCDSYDSTIDTTLVSAKVSAYGVIIPEFDILDGFTPLLPEHMVPLLQATLNATSHLYFKQQVSQPDEARVRRQLAQARTRNQSVSDREHYYANGFGRR